MSTSGTSCRRLSSATAAPSPTAATLSREALAELGNVIYNEVPRMSSLTVGRYTYFNVFRGDALCAFLKRYFRDRRRITLSETQVLSIARALRHTGIFVIISSSHSHNNNKRFSNHHDCLCHLRQVRTPPKHTHESPSTTSRSSNIRRNSARKQ